MHTQCFPCRSVFVRLRFFCPCFLFVGKETRCAVELRVFLLPFATFWPRDSYTAFCCVFERKTVHFSLSQERQGKRIRRTETSQSDLSKGHIAETILSNFWIAELIKNSRRRRNQIAVVDVGTEWQKTNAKRRTKTPTRRRKFAFQT